MITLLIDNQELSINEVFTVSTKLGNRGIVASAASKLLFLLSTDSNVTLNDTRLAELPTKELFADESAVYSAGSLRLSTPGNFWLGACVLEIADEADTSNNCTAATAVLVNDQQNTFTLPSILLLLLDEEP